jgi:hypothetical protein
MELFLSRFAFIFLIYAVVSSGYINEILSCQMREFLRGSRFFRHIIGILMVFVFIMLEGGWSLTPGQDDLAPNNWSSGQVFHTLALAIGIYIIFLVSSKSQLTPNLIFFVLVLTIYFINTYRNYLKARNQLTEEQNRTILRGTQGLFVLTLGVLLYGFYDYILYQKGEYGPRFQWDLFLFGTSKCSHLKNNF